MKNKINKLIPSYSWLILIAAVSLNMLSYFGLRAIYTPSKYYMLNTALDDAIPFLPIFIIPYVLAYVQWIVGYIVIVRDSRYLCFRCMTAEIMAKLVCFLCFLLFPVTIAGIRPEISELTGNDFCTWLTRLIFTADAPTNLFPSIHCLESYFVMRCGFSCKKVGKTYHIINVIFAILVFASTVFLKQHYISDFIAAVVTAEVFLFICKRLPFIRRLSKTDNS